MTECEALLLGREQVHGSANGTALATLCKSLMRRTDLHRKYILRCHRENGLQMVPYRRIEDEGFESDEDLTSLGSCDDNSSSIYVSDHALHVLKCRTTSTSTNGSGGSGSTSSTSSSNSNTAASVAAVTSATTGPLTTQTICNPRTSSQSSSTDVTSGSVSSVGTDSANSSGASDNDETDNSLSHNVNHNSSSSCCCSSSSSRSSSNCCCSCCNSSGSCSDRHHCTNHHNMLCNGALSLSSSSSSSSSKTKLQDDVESFAYHEIAFCHTDPALPKIIVWVLKTKRQSKSSAHEYSYGLEAVVFLCLSEQKFRALNKCFQEFSRRQKLEKPLRSRWKDEYHRNGTITTTTNTTATSTTATAAAIAAVAATIKRVSATDSKAAAAAAVAAASAGGKAPTSRGESGASNNAVMYNLVQRVDTDGVTHIEVTRPAAAVADARSPRVQLADEHTNEPSSIISINTPDSGDVLKTVSAKNADKLLLIESVIRTTEDGDTVVASTTSQQPPSSSSSSSCGSSSSSSSCLLLPPPERPERKKNAKSLLLDKEKMAVVLNYNNNSMPNREKVVKGQYVRVSVDPKTILSSPLPRGVGGVGGGGGGGGGWLFNELKPVSPNNVLAYPSRLVWSRNDNDNYQKQLQQQQQLQQQHHQFHDLTLVRRGRKPEKDHREHRHRSKSSVILRRPESPKRYPMPHRYVDAIQINNSLPNRFFGRLKELTTGHHGGSGGVGGGGGGGKFKRRNSIGDMSRGCATVNGHLHPQDGKKFDKHNSLAKSTPNLKSMIKNKNGRFCKDGYNENEPKKVTFSAYATVQVVD